ncbi:AAA family ATPase [Brevibacillus formosus]|uniref:AAA family ATPase n=1 Tax=Brevibacillus formosus TaxID=54913 RepID=UPI003F1AB0A0
MLRVFRNTLISEQITNFMQDKLLNNYQNKDSITWYGDEPYELFENCFISTNKFVESLYEEEDEQTEIKTKVNKAIGEIYQVVVKAKTKSEKQLEDFKICYIPSKRELEVTKEVKSNDGPKANGTGILNEIFFYKNQSVDSKNYIRYLRIKEQFKKITAGFDFDITLRFDNKLQLNFTNSNRHWIPAVDCGLGLQDLLIILYFANSDYGLILIDEAETHLHPEMQRKLLSVLKNDTHIQVFISTHSNVFLDSNLIDRVYHVYFDNKINLSDATNRSEILNDLGFSVADNLISDLVILCEGPSDKPIIEEFLIKMGLLERYNVKIWPLGGDIMDQVDLSVFKDTYKIIALMDLDPGSRSVRERFKRNCAEIGIPVKQLERYAIENYFTIEALRKVFGSQIDISVTSISHKTKVEEQLGLNPKKCNRRIAKAMSLEDIEETDLYDFLMEVKKMLSN